MLPHTHTHTHTHLLLLLLLLLLLFLYYTDINIMEAFVYLVIWFKTFQLLLNYCHRHSRCDRVVADYVSQIEERTARATLQHDVHKHMSSKRHVTDDRRNFTRTSERILLENALTIWLASLTVYTFDSFACILSWLPFWSWIRFIFLIYVVYMRRDQNLAYLINNHDNVQILIDAVQSKMYDIFEKTKERYWHVSHETLQTHYLALKAQARSLLYAFLMAPESHNNSTAKTTEGSRTEISPGQDEFQEPPVIQQPRPRRYIPRKL